MMSFMEIFSPGDKEEEKKEDGGAISASSSMYVPLLQPPSSETGITTAASASASAVLQEQAKKATVLLSPKEAVRQLQLFYPDEIIRGARLGQGSFADVFAVERFELHTTTTTTATTTTTSSGNSSNPQQEQQDKEEDHDQDQHQPEDQENGVSFTLEQLALRQEYMEDSKPQNADDTIPTTTTTTTTNNNQDGATSPSQQAAASSSSASSTPLKSKKKKQKLYAIKCLRREFDDPNPKMFRRAAKDLELECSFLATMNHPHIIKVYAKSALVKKASDCQTPLDAIYFFLVEDRLSGTLTCKINEWKQIKHRIIVEPLFFRGVRTSERKKKALLEEQLVVADAVASALQYMHDTHRMIYRDLKPDNVGFDADGICKLFDFGLARRLPVSATATASSSAADSTTTTMTTNYNNMTELFKMSGKTGNLLLMAPEVWQEQPYNEKVDVYSFAMLLWMMLALDCLPYRELLVADMSGFIKKVIVKGHRPEIKSKWSKSIQVLLRKAWSKEINQRPTMREVCHILHERHAGRTTPLPSPPTPGSPVAKTPTTTSPNSHHRPATLMRSSFM